MSRVVASLLAALVLLNGLGALADCAGWQSSSSERMACCLEVEDGCPDQLSADACCAGSEQAQQPTVMTASIGLPSAAPVVVPSAVFGSAWLRQLASVAPFDHAIQKRPHDPTYLRNSVLLI